MAHPNQSNAPGSRERGQGRVRLLTRAAALLATGATVAIGIVVAHDHPGASSLHPGANTSGSTAGTGTSTGGSSSDGTSGNTGNTGNSGDTDNSGNTGSSGSSAPTPSSSTPTVNSGGSAR
jgi:hypothetical protein